MMTIEAACSISIVVPVYNVAPYLRECLNSLVGQTFRDIEIICVDDGSNDGSETILDEYAARDARVTILRHANTMTAAQSRKDGALASHGEFILFVDPDDMLADTACADLLTLMRQHPVDVLHFPATVLADASLPENRVKHVTSMLTPHKGFLRGPGLVRECFVRKRFGFQIWNKLFKGDVCREAMAQFPDGPYPKAQDIMALFMILFYARSYRGVQTKPLYFYRLGVGITGGNCLSRRQIDAYAHQPLVVDGLRRFLADQRAEAAHQESLNAIDDHLCRDMLGRLRHHVAKEDVPYAWETMCRVLGATRLVSMLTKYHAGQEDDWAQYLRPAVAPCAKKSVKCIGAYYYCLNKGGVQRVTATLSQLWTKMGYQVVLFTDAQPSDDDFPHDAIRVVLPDCRDEHTPEAREERMRILSEAIETYHIDLVIYHAWLYQMLLWDMLAIKSAGAAFYIHTHSVFSMPLLVGTVSRRFYELRHTFAIADGIIALSQTNAAYWRTVHPRVFSVVNPMFFDLSKTTVSPLSGKTIVWVGRIALEKNPVQAIEIFSKVLKQVPDAKLSVIGSGFATLEEKMRERAEQLCVVSSVTFHGFQKDVLPFYQQSDVFLCTSAYEGFPLSYLEAQGCGLPTVTYDMPYLSILESGQGSVCVPQQDTDAAAQAVVELLTNESLRRRVGREARENVEQNFNIDLAAQWANIFHSAGEPVPTQSGDPQVRLMLQTLCDHLQHTQSPPIPLPSRGPFKALRQKAAIFLHSLLIQGVRPTLKTVRDYARLRIRRLRR